MSLRTDKEAIEILSRFIVINPIETDEEQEVLSAYASIGCVGHGFSLEEEKIYAFLTQGGIDFVNIMMVRKNKKGEKYESA